MTHQTKNPVDIDSFHQVKATLCIGKCGNTVTLEQENGSDQPDVVMLHPLQLRHFDERFGCLEPGSVITPPSVRTLSRRLRMLAFHIEHLRDSLVDHPVHRHADMTFEMTKANMLSEMADEFCADLPDEVTQPMTHERYQGGHSSQDVADPSDDGTHPPAHKATQPSLI